MKRYRLLKDLPDLKAGAIFELQKYGYTCNVDKYSDDFYTRFIGMPIEIIENCSEWFEEVLICAKCHKQVADLNFHEAWCKGQIKEKEDEMKHLHYLKVLQKNYSHYQPDVRNAIDYAIQEIEKINES